jgi:hypothetical protein
LAQHEHDGFVLRDLRLLQKLPGGEAPLVIVGNRGYRYQDKLRLAQVLEIKP